MQIVSNGQIKSCFLVKLRKKYFNISSAENFTQSAKL